MIESNDLLKNKISVLIRARYPLIYIISWEEERVAVMLNMLASKAENKQLLIWSTTEGFSDYSGKIIDGEAVDPFMALTFIVEYQRPAIFMLKDFHPFMQYGCQ